MVLGQDRTELTDLNARHNASSPHMTSAESFCQLNGNPNVTFRAQLAVRSRTVVILEC